MADSPVVSPAADLVAVRVDDFEPAARAILPQAIYDYFAGGAEDEAALAGNRAAFGRWRFRYRVLTGAADPDLSLELLGRQQAMPVQLSPAATQRMAHPDGELAAARAAAAAGVVYCLSTLSTASLEEVAGSAAEGQRWFQLYVFKDRGITSEMLDRVTAAGYQAIALTVDTPILGRRERDLRNAFGLPAGFQYENLLGPLARSGPADVGESALATYFSTQLDHALTWKDLEWLIGYTRLPVLVKGVVRADDARRCLAAGAGGIIVSNHGGRQLDYAIATLDALPGIVDAVGADIPVLLDGGVRRGTDVLKALALGARSVMIGRPYLWALAVGGEAGVRRLLDLLRQEISISMSLLGVRRLDELSPDLLERV
jgi:isopentenyl diphosphate isomerase/L-lactate dehydrogenase-like FMN-dependent dehydrogenase